LRCAAAGRVQQDYAALRPILAHADFRRAPALIWTAIADELPALQTVVSAELARKV